MKNLNDLIKEKGEDFVHVTRLDIPEEVSDLRGIERFDNLKILEIGEIEDHSLLSNCPLFHNCNLVYTLNKIGIYEDSYLRHVSFLRDYLHLEKIVIWDCDNIEDFPRLVSNSLKSSVKEMEIHSAFYSLKNLSFLRDYLHLEKIVIFGNYEIEDYSGLDSVFLKRTVRELNLGANYNLKDLFFLRDFQKLEKINLELCDNISDHSALGSDLLKSSVKEVNLDSNVKFTDLSILGDYKRLEYLNLTATSIRNIYEILDYEFVKNGSLYSIVLPDSIDWLKIKDGKYVNTEAIHKLKEMGVQVELPSNFPYDQEIEPKSKLYIVCGPSGAGKSTLIRYMKEELGVKQMRKATTRGYRSDSESSSGELASLPEPEFENKARRKEILAAHPYYGTEYGVLNIDLMEAQLSKDKYLLDFVDVESALKLRESNLGFIEVILVLIPPDLIEKGLTTRLRDLSRSKADDQLLNTEARIGNIAKEYQRLFQYRTEVDHSIEGMTYEENVRRLKKIIRGELA